MALDKSHLLMLTVTLQAAMEENVGLSQAMEAKDKEIAALRARLASVERGAGEAQPAQPNGGTEKVPPMIYGHVGHGHVGPGQGT